MHSGCKERIQDWNAYSLKKYSRCKERIQEEIIPQEGIVLDEKREYKWNSKHLDLKFLSMWFFTIFDWFFVAWGCYSSRLCDLSSRTQLPTIMISKGKQVLNISGFTW